MNRKSVFYFFSGILFFLLQIILSKLFAWHGIFPNFLLLSTIYFGMTFGSLSGIWFGFVWGLGADILSLSIFGSQAFMFVCVGAISGMMRGQVDKDKILAQLASVLGLVAFFALGLWFWEFVLRQNPERFRFKLTFLQVIYTVLVSPIFFGVCSSWQRRFKVE